MELMAAIRAREERQADAEGRDEQPTGLAALHEKIARRVKGRR